MSWWLAGGVDPSDVIAAYQAIGANSFDDSEINLAHPGMNNITWQNPPPPAKPTWNTAIGWTQYAETDYITGGEISLPITYIWRGKLDNSYPGGNNNIVMNSTGWSGFIGICIGGGRFMIGFNAWFSAAFTVTITDFDIQHTIAYQKLVDNTQNLWIDGVLQTGSPKVGTTPTDFWISIYTGNKACESVALYRAVLTPAQIEAITVMMSKLGNRGHRIKHPDYPVHKNKNIIYMDRRDIRKRKW